MRAASRAGATWGSRDVIVFSAGTPPRTRARLGARRRGHDRSLIGTAAGPPSFPMVVISCTRRPADWIASLGILLGSIEPAPDRTAIARRQRQQRDLRASGLLLFVRGERLLQQRFDLDRLEMSGEATTVVEQVLYNPGGGRARLLGLGNWRPGIPIRLHSQQPIRLVRSRGQTARNRRPSGQLPNTGSVTGRSAAGLRRCQPARHLDLRSVATDPVTVHQRSRHRDGARVVSGREQDRLSDRPGWNVRKGCHRHGHRAAPAQSSR